MKEYTPITKRNSLIDQLPLDTPFSIHICPSTWCNFKCVYCKQGVLTENNEPTLEFDRKFMDMELFKLIIEQIKEFPHKLKLLNFAWLGEPLLHPRIAEMVRIAKEAEIAERVEIVSNGSLLTHELSRNLVDAGLDRIRISLQGLSEKDYLEMSRYKIKMEEYIENIKYLHDYVQNSSGETKVYIKIMDAMIKEKKDEEKFQLLFTDICDAMNIETLVPLVQDSDITDLKKEFEYGYWGNVVEEVQICPQPFYLLIITPEGIVLPCCEADGCKLNVGKISQENNLLNIWTGKDIHYLRKIMIEKKRYQHPICSKCNVIKYQISDEDKLDEYVKELKEMYLDR